MARTHTSITLLTVHPPGLESFGLKVEDEDKEVEVQEEDFEDVEQEDEDQLEEQQEDEAVGYDSEEYSGQLVARLTRSMASRMSTYGKKIMMIKCLPSSKRVLF